MPTITVRLFHHPSRTPIAELQGVDPGATLSSLRAMAERHLAAEEACMMRVFARWHMEAVFVGRKRLIELTEEDSGVSLSSLGIEDYSAVLLEGPLTGDFEGVGQGLALVAAQVREQNKQLEEQNNEIRSTLSAIKDLLQQVVAGQCEIATEQRRNSLKAALPDIEFLDRLLLVAEERRAFDLLSLQKAAVASSIAVAGEEAKARGELLVAAILEYQRYFPRFAIDTTTPRADVRLKDLYTAVRTADNDSVTLRASQPLSLIKHRWAVRIHEGGSQMYICLGLLPKLSADKEAEMEGTHITPLGGWCIQQWHSDSYVRGDWQCEKLPFRKGSLVLFDYSFRDKTLTIRCGGRQVVGRIPKAGEELYPAFTLGYSGDKVSFENYPSF